MEHTSTAIYLTDYEIVIVAAILAYWRGSQKPSPLDKLIDKFNAAAQKVVDNDK